MILCSCSGAGPLSLPYRWRGYYRTAAAERVRAASRNSIFSASRRLLTPAFLVSPTRAFIDIRWYPMGQFDGCCWSWRALPFPRSLLIGSVYVCTAGTRFVTLGDQLVERWPAVTARLILNDCAILHGLCDDVDVWQFGLRRDDFWGWMGDEWVAEGLVWKDLSMRDCREPKRGTTSDREWPSNRTYSVLRFLQREIEKTVSSCQCRLLFGSLITMDTGRWVAFYIVYR